MDDLMISYSVPGVAVWVRIWIGMMCFIIQGGGRRRWRVGEKSR